MIFLKHLKILCKRIRICWCCLYLDSITELFTSWSNFYNSIMIPKNVVLLWNNLEQLFNSSKNKLQIESIYKLLLYRMPSTTHMMTNSRRCRQNELWNEMLKLNLSWENFISKIFFILVVLAVVFAVVVVVVIVLAVDIVQAKIQIVWTSKLTAL